MGEFVYSIKIAAAPERVWRTYVDPSRIPDWQTRRPVIAGMRGAPGDLGSTYVSRRGRLSARTTVLASTAPALLVTRTDAYFALHLEITSRLEGRSVGTGLEVTAATVWPRGRRLVGKVVAGRSSARGRQTRS